MIRSPLAGRSKTTPRWRSLLFGLLASLAACSPIGENRVAGAATPASAVAETAGPARFAENAFVAEDGARLPLRKWLPRGPVKAVILALHGFNDYSNAFEMPAKVWARRGIATYAYDQRGFGGAPLRERWAGAGRLAVDAITATRLLRLIYPGRPIYLLGESMGGAVSILAATGAMSGVIPGPDGMPTAEAAGVILSAPAVWGRATMDLLPRIALAASVRLFPETVLTGRGLRIQASDNLPMLQALARDPMVIKGARVDAVYGLVDLMDEALAAAPRLTMPLLLMYGAKDMLVPRHALREFAAHLPATADGRQRRAYYPQGYHMLLRDLEGPVVAGDVASWVLSPSTSLPSGADARQPAQGWPPAAPEGS